MSDEARPLNNGTRAMTTAANTGAGGRDWQTKLRRDEVVRCMGVLGWSWPVLGQRLEIGGLQGALRIKMCKREISDGDLEWLSSLAAAVEAVPRPVPAEPAADPQGDEGSAVTEGAVQQTAGAMTAMGSTMAAETAAEVEQRVIEAIVAQYRSPVAGWQGWSADEVRAARGALSELLVRLGWLDRAKGLLAASAPKAAASPAAVVTPAPRSSPWAAPQAASQLTQRVMRREPFGS